MRIIKRLFKKPIVWVIAGVAALWYISKNKPDTWKKITDKVPFLGKVMPGKTQD